MFNDVRVPWKKSFNGKFRRVTTRGVRLAFGDYGLVATGAGEFKVSQINAAWQALRKALKGKGMVHCRVCPNYSVTKKPLKVKMGGGKGKFSHYSAFVSPGKILFEVALTGGGGKAAALDALRIASSKVPMKTSVVDF